MKLILKKIEAILPPLYPQENLADPVAVVKFFDPCGRYTFLALEARRGSDGDLLLVAYFGPPDYRKPRQPASDLN